MQTFQSQTLDANISAASITIRNVWYFEVKLKVAVLPSHNLVPTFHGEEFLKEQEELKENLQHVDISFNNNDSMNKPKIKKTQAVKNDPKHHIRFSGTWLITTVPIIF